MAQLTNSLRLTHTLRRLRTVALVWVVGAGAAGCGPSDDPAAGRSTATAVATTPDSASAGTALAFPPRFETFTVADGLPSNNVRGLLQDRQGFLWAATGDGLSRFDGVTFTEYHHDPADPASLGDNVTRPLFEGRDGQIWVGTASGLDRYDPATETFAHVRHDSDDPESLGDGAVTALAEDAGGTLWVGTWGSGLHRYDAATGTFAHVRHDPDDPESLFHDNVYALAVAPSGVLWVGTATGINRIDPAGPGAGTPSRVDIDVSPFGGAGYVTGYALCLDRSGDLWIGTYGRGLVRYDTDTGETRNYPAGPGGLGHSWVLSITEDRAGTLWVGTDGGGLHRYDADRDAFERFAHDPADATSLADDRVLSLAEDREGVLWVGTGRGLSRRLPLSRVVAQERHRPGDPRSLSADDVTAFVEDAGGALWVGTDGGGLNRRDSATGSFERVPLPGSLARERDAATILSLAATPDGSVWVSTYDGLFRRRGSGAFEPFVVADSTGAPFDRVLSGPLAVGTPGRLWAGTQFGLYDVDVESGRALRYRPAPLDPASNVAQSVFSLLSEPDGTLWLGGEPTTLYRFDPEATTFTNVRTAPGGRAPAGAVSALLRAWSGALWVGTASGLERMGPDGGWRRYGRADGLPNTSVHGLVEDPAGHVWAATNRGLSRLDPEAGTFQSWSARDGLQGDVSNEGAVYQSPRTGTVYVGGDHGYDAFDPLAIRAEPPPPPPVLTGLWLSGEPVRIGAEGSPLGRALPMTDALRLRYADRVVTFTFASLDFSAPASQQYAVRLDGFDDDWRAVGGQREATFTNLSPGTYTFRVRAAGRDGVWGGETALAVTVVPPWWRTWWAFLGYALVAGGALAALYRTRQDRLRLRHRVEIEHLEAEKLRDLDRAKSHFFANVSHEFRTPLTLTLGPLDDVLAGEYGPVPAEATGPLALARRSAGRVLGLIGQILDLSRLEAGSAPFRARRLDLAAFARSQAEAFGALAAHRRIALSVDVPDAPVEIWADPAHLGTVVSNVLSNALKFTPEGGRVAVTVGAIAGAASVSVRDTGPGIAAADLPHVFDRFYQVGGVRGPGQPLGTGIGLALAHDLARLHGGTLTAESETAEANGAPSGSTFTLALPLGRAHLGDHQVEDAPWDGAVAPTARAPDAPAVDERAADETDDDATTVLVADDHADIRAYLRRHLEAAGYRVAEAEDGQAALDRIRERLPDLVVSDVMMPRLDGLGLCRALRADPETDFVPVLLLTAKAAPEDRLDGLAELCDDYLTKPFDVRELVARVGNIIALRQRLRDRFGGDGVTGGPAAIRDLPLSADAAFVAAVRAAIDGQLTDETFNVAALAEAVGQSRSTLLRRTSDLMDAAPSDLLRTARLDRAARLLAARAGTVSEVAYGVGFKSVAHFSNAFLAHTGSRPSAYADAER